MQRPIAVGLLALAAPSQDPIPTPLAAELTPLADQSAWGQDSRFEGQHPDKSQRGVYPVGNGNVFAYLGLGARANTLQGLTGPNYRVAAGTTWLGHFGELTFDLLVEDEVADLPLQRVRRVRGANFVATEDADDDGIALRTLTFAPPDQTVLVRVIEVVNPTARTLTGVSLRVSADGEVTPVGDGTLREDFAADGQSCSAFYRLSGANSEGAAQLLSIGELQPEETRRAVFTLTTVVGNPAPGTATPAANDVDDALEMARTTWSWWQRKLASTSRLDTDHVKLRDLFEDWKVLMLVQRCNQSGVISPMINTRGARVRDSNGAVLALLRYHLWEEAKSILTYFHGAIAMTGEVVDHLPLDLDIDASRSEKTDWNKVVVTANETPSWIILQHFWYWRATGDSELIRKHWPLLEVCMKKQPRGARGEMTFDPGSGVLDRALYRQADEMYSFGNGVLFLMAVQAMAEMTTGIDREVNPEKYARQPKPEPRGAALMRRSAALMRDLEELYWVADEGRFAPALEPVERTPLSTPLANSNLLPLWVGWTFATGDKSPDNLQHSLEQLWRDGARIGSTPTLGYASGDLQGMLVAALAERDGKRRMDAVDALLEMAEPAGEWGQLYDTDGRPVAVDHPDWPNRLRPGEGGINLDAILFAVTGVRFVSYANWDSEDIRLDLRLPHGATYLSVRNVEKDGRRLDIHMREVHETLSAESWEANAHRLPESQRNPYGPHRQLRFVVELMTPNPPKGYHNLAVTAMGTVFVRYLRAEQAVEETEIWVEDDRQFLPADPAARPGGR